MEEIVLWNNQTVLTCQMTLAARFRQKQHICGHSKPSLGPSTSLVRYSSLQPEKKGDAFLWFHFLHTSKHSFRLLADDGDH
jgi:hypothetical protein